MSDELKDNERNIIAGENSSIIGYAKNSTRVSIGSSSTSVGCEKNSSCSGPTNQ